MKENVSHFSEPYMPQINGVETFIGEVIHSHSYRVPDGFRKKSVLIIGAGPSGIDIGIDISQYARSVYLSHNKPIISSKLPYNMSQVTTIKSINGNEVILEDNSILIIDCLVYCTGYKYSFPFLDKSCAIDVHSKKYPLYKHLISIDNPTMAIIGIPSRVIPFAMFHIQVQYYMKVLTACVKLPTKDCMIIENDNASTSHRSYIFDEEFQWQYNDDLATSANIEKLPLFYENGYREWTKIRSSNLLQCKDFEIKFENDSQEVRFEN